MELVGILLVVLKAPRKYIWRAQQECLFSGIMTQLHEIKMWKTLRTIFWKETRLSFSKGKQERSPKQKWRQRDKKNIVIPYTVSVTNPLTQAEACPPQRTKHPDKNRAIWCILCNVARSAATVKIQHLSEAQRMSSCLGSTLWNNLDHWEW